MRRLVNVTYVFACALLVVLLLLPWVNVLADNVVPVLQALIPVWLLLAIVPLAVALMRRTRGAVGVGTVVVISALASGWLVGHTSSTGAAPGPVAGPRPLRVLSLNCEVGGVDAKAVAQLVRQIHPDIIVFVEMTASKLKAIDADGVKDAYPNRSAGMVDDGARGSVILSKYPVRTIDADTNLGPKDLQSPVASVRAPGGDVLVHAVHSYPPLADGVREWRSQLERVASWKRANPNVPFIIAGDFNASRAHPAYRDLASGLTDAVAQQKTGLWPTWPHGDWRPAFTQIDHILVQGFSSKDGGIVAVKDTDHAAIWADVEP